MDWITILIWCLALAAQLIFSILIGRTTAAKGYSFAMGFCLSMFASPLIGWMVAMWLPEKDAPAKIRPEVLLAIEMEKARLEAEQAGQ